MLRIGLTWLVMGAVLMGCGKRELNQYRIVDLQSELFAVVREDSGLVVGPNVTHWATYEHYMIVKKVPYIYRRSEVFDYEDFMELDGYIIIDTLSGIKISYSSEEEMRENIASMGIPADIILKEIPGPI